MPNRKNYEKLVRIANTDLNGEKPIGYTLKNIKGINFQFANAVCESTNIDKNKKAADLSEEEIKKIEDVLKSPLEKGIPAWMSNRRKDYEEGKDKHIITNDLILTTENDIKRMKKIKSYKGRRHTKGLPARGQKTKSNFRKSKGKVTGVKRKKVKKV